MPSISIEMDCSMPASVLDELTPRKDSEAPEPLGEIEVVAAL